MNKSWPLVRLGEVLHRAEEMVELKPDVTYRQITVKLWGKGVVLRGLLTGAEIASPRQMVARHGQIILSRIDARNGALGIVPPELDGAIVTNDFPVFKILENRLNPAFLGWMCRTASFVEECKRASEGTTNRVRLQEDKFLAREIPLPPLADQRRVVARIEELAALIQEAQTLSQQVGTETEVLSYSWLRHLRQELSTSSHPKCQLGNLTKVTAGGTPSRDNPSFWNGDIPWIKTGELLDSDIAKAAEYITPSGVEESSAKLFPPDTILIALYGQGQTRGRTGRLLIPATTNQACCAILPKPEAFEPRYLQYWLRSLYFELREDAQGGAQPNWNGAMIKNLEITIPPLSEQRRIVVELDALQTEVNTLKHLQAETATELDALLPAILDKAFKGEL